jgi:hypothetical protein
MKAHYENNVMSSLMLLVDHYMLLKGEAYTNHSGVFYPVDNLYNGYYTYAAPFKQFVSDDSITNARVMKYVYVDPPSNQLEPGRSDNDLHGINHYNGQVYFTTNQGSSLVSGNYAVKDFNVYLTNDPEQKLLFETKPQVNPKFPQQLSGLAPDTQTYPAIFLKNMGGVNEPFAFGGLDNTITRARLVVLADSSFKLDATCGILKDLRMKTVSIIEDLPFDAMGSYTGISTLDIGNYNYTALATGNGPLVTDVRVSKMTSLWREFENLNPNVFSAFVDFDLSTLRSHS